MTSYAIFRVVGFEGLGAVMAFTAELARIYFRHFHLGRALFYLENLRVAVKAFMPLVGMHLAVKGTLPMGASHSAVLPTGTASAEVAITPKISAAIAVVKQRHK